MKYGGGRGWMNMRKPGRKILTAICALIASNQTVALATTVPMFDSHPVIWEWKPKEGEGWGFVNKRGREVLATKYSAVHFFSKGGRTLLLGVVWPAQKKLGPYEVNVDIQECDSAQNPVGQLKHVLIDKVALALLLKGDESEAIFQIKSWNHELLNCSISSFDSGTAQVCGPDSKWTGIINEQGEWLIKVKDADVFKFGHTFFMSKFQESQLVQIDGSGKLRNAYKFEEPHNAFDNLIIAKLVSDHSAQRKGYKLLDSEGNIIRDLSIYDDLRTNTGPGKSSLVAAKLKSTQKWGAINSSGQIMIPFEYDGITIWNSSTIMADKGGKNFLIDSLGQKISPSFWCPPMPFSDAFAVLIQESKTPRIDLRFLSPPQKYWAIYHRNTGELIKTDFLNYECQFSPSGTLLTNQYAPGSKGGFTLFDSYMKEIASWPNASSVDVLRGDDNILLISTINKSDCGHQLDHYHFIDMTGKRLFPQEYNGAEPFYRGFAAVRRGPGEPTALPVKQSRPQ